MDIAPLGLSIDSASALKAIKDLRALDAAAEKTEAKINKLSKTPMTFGDSKFLKSASDGFKNYSDDLEQLRTKYNPLYAASKQFEAQQAELQRALALGAISVSQYDAALEGLQDGMIRSVGASHQFGKSMAASSQHTTNLMFQFQDIGMMLAAGQNPLMLAMQQGMQIAGVFKQMEGTGQSAFSAIKGGLLGLVSPTSLLTLGVIAGGAALVQWGMSAMGAGEDARTLDDAISELDAASSGLKSTQDILGMSVDELSVKYGSYGTVIRQVATDLAANQLAQMNDTLTQSILEGADAFDKYAGASNTMWSSGITAAQAFSNIKRELGVTGEEAEALYNSFNKLRSAMTIEDRIAAYRQVQDALRAAGVNADKLPKPLNDAMVEAGRLAIKMGEAKGAAEALGSASMGGLIGGLEGAIGKAKALAAQLWDAAAAAAANGSDLAPSSSGRPMPRGQGTVIDLQNETVGSGSSGGGGGGGGGITDPYADNLKRLVESLRTEQETVDSWYNENLSILNDRRAMEILGEQAHKDALLDLEREYLEKKQGLNDGYGQFSLDSASNLFGELNSLSGSGYDGLLKAQKAFGAASALINTYTAASQALADPSLPFFAKFAAVAKTVAAGMGLVNAIKGGGGSVSGGASATTSATTASRAEPDRVTRVELQGEDWIVSLAESMMTQIYDASKNGRVIVARA